MNKDEKIKDLEQRIALMDADNSALCADLIHWKRVAAGLKGRMLQMSERVEHYKRLCIEGDHLNEERIAKIEEDEKVIKGLHEQVNALVEINGKLESDINEKEDVIGEYELTIIELQKPWWKKIF